MHHQALLNAVVFCPRVSKLNLNAPSLKADLKLPDICTDFYRSQNTMIAKEAELLIDHKINSMYKSFVRFRIKAKLESIHHDHLVFFITFSSICLICFWKNLWHKFPSFSCVIENFLDLVMECYNYLSPIVVVTYDSYYREYFFADFLPESTTTSASKDLYKKV